MILFSDVHPPCYTFFMLVWEALLGDSELVVRLPSLLFGCASIWMFFVVVRGWFGRKTAWLATGLMAVSPVHIWYSHEAKNNMLLLLMTLVTVYCVQKAWEEDHPRHWMLFVLSALRALWTNLFALWVVCGLFLWLFIQAAREGRYTRMRRVWMSGAAVPVGWMPFLWMALSHSDTLIKSYLRPFMPGDAYYLFLIYLSHGNTLRTISPYRPFGALFEQPWWYFSVEAFFLALMILGGWSWLRLWRADACTFGKRKLSDRAKIELVFLYLAIPPASVLTASVFYRNQYIERSMIILLPPFLVMISCGVMAWRSRFLQRIFLAALLLFNCCALFNLSIAKADTWTVYRQNPDWKSAAKYLGEQFGTVNAPGFIIHNTPGETLDYSYARFLKTERRLAAGNFPAQLPHGLMVVYDEKRFMDFLSQFGVERVYLIHELNWSQNFEGLIRPIQANAVFQAEGVIHFKELDIYKFRVNLGVLRKAPDPRP
jgi:4-amino-4-deoxy-L-arabinose transferase-like glycosyltransferase